MDLVERHEPDPVRRRELLERGSAFFFAYADRMIRMVSDEYARERELLLRSSEQRRFHLVRELLDGAQLDSSSLGYDLSAWHVGMVVWGAHAGDTAHRLAHVHGRRFLAVGVVEDTYWGWLGLGHVALGLFLGFVMAAVIGIGLIITKLRSRKDAIPFGPFLALGGAVSVLWGEQILAWYLGRF